MRAILALIQRIPKLSLVEQEFNYRPVPSFRALLQLGVSRQDSETSVQARSRSKPQYRRLSRSWSTTGSPRFLENPSHTSAPLSDLGRFERAEVKPDQSRGLI